MTITIDTDRLARIETLKHGNHKPPNGDFAACVMEANDRELKRAEARAALKAARGER